MWQVFRTHLWTSLVRPTQSSSCPQVIGKDSDAGRDWGQEEKGTTEDEMAGWHHRLDGHEFEWTPGDGDGQGGLACYNSWGHKESDTTERLNWTELNWRLLKNKNSKKKLHKDYFLIPLLEKVTDAKGNNFQITMKFSSRDESLLSFMIFKHNTGLSIKVILITEVKFLSWQLLYIPHPEQWFSTRLVFSKIFVVFFLFFFF